MRLINSSTKSVSRSPIDGAKNVPMSDRPNEHIGREQTAYEQ